MIYYSLPCNYRLHSCQFATAPTFTSCIHTAAIRCVVHWMPFSTRSLISLWKKWTPVKASVPPSQAGSPLSLNTSVFHESQYLVRNASLSWIQATLVWKAKAGFGYSLVCGPRTDFLLHSCCWFSLHVSRLTKVQTSILSLIPTLSSASFLHSSPFPGYSEGIWPWAVATFPGYQSDLLFLWVFTEHFWYRSGLDLSSSVKSLKWLAKIWWDDTKFYNTPPKSWLTVSKDINNWVFLKITSVYAPDNATYYCAQRAHWHSLSWQLNNRSGCFSALCLPPTVYGFGSRHSFPASLWGFFYTICFRALAFWYTN